MGGGRSTQGRGVRESGDARQEASEELFLLSGTSVCRSFQNESQGEGTWRARAWHGHLHLQKGPRSPTVPSASHNPALGAPTCPKSAGRWAVTHAVTAPLLKPRSAQPGF